MIRDAAKLKIHVLSRARSLVASKCMVAGRAGDYGSKHRLLASKAEEVKGVANDAADGIHHRTFTKGRIRHRQFISTSVTEPFAVPLTLSDVHLKDEQLPFAYVFKDTLDSQRLIDSFGEILRRYPILGSRTDFAAGKIPTLQCSKDDNVSMSFGESTNSLEDWIAMKRSGELQHDDWFGGGGAPLLSPLFDDLVSDRWVDRENMSKVDQTETSERDSLATVRITYFAGGGTAVGINISHLLGDASSCFRIAQAWGREMRGLDHPIGASNDRASATLAGMVSPEMADILNLGVGPRTETNQTNTSQTMALLFRAFDYIERSFGVNDKVKEADEGNTTEYKSDAPLSTGHEYVRLQFSEESLQAMKAFGMAHCASAQSKSNDGKIEAPFVSTNDMITAFGWMMKRYTSEEREWNISLVVNLRNRGGIDEFSNVRESSGQSGTFGNALTSIVAELPRSTGQTTSLDEIGDAALAIRHALEERMRDVPNLLALSQAGKASQAQDQMSCFSSTSWRQFPLWEINFGGDGKCSRPTDAPAEPLFGFYAIPSYALPVGDTYSSILVPSQCGGCTYKLLAPSRQVQSILTLHSDLSAMFLSWAKSRNR